MMCRTFFLLDESFVSGYTGLVSIEGSNMSEVTRLATNAIRVYPELYPNRLRFLQTMFSRYSGCYQVDRDTGNMYSRDGISDTDQYVIEVTKASELADRLPATRMARQRSAMIAKWTSENAADLAQDSVHDTMEYVGELGWPTYGAFGEEVPVENMSADTRNAFMEVLFAYESAYDRAMFLDANPDVQAMTCEKTWNLSWKRLECIFKSAEEMLERLLGTTKAERHAEREEFSNRIMAKLKAEMKAEGTW